MLKNSLVTIVRKQFRVYKILHISENKTIKKQGRMTHADFALQACTQVQGREADMSQHCWCSV